MARPHPVVAVVLHYRRVGHRDLSDPIGLAMAVDVLVTVGDEVVAVFVGRSREIGGSLFQAP